jgi:RNA polymerase sigma factor (sigma-70 family)
MSEIESRDLLRSFAEDRSESAFRELVNRHLPMVYSTALRRLGGDTHLAEDVSQTVFTDLAQKAGTLPGDVILGGWLHRHTGFVAANFLRAEERRQNREREAVEMNALQELTESVWKDLVPVLDAAIDDLTVVDREAIVLRFFEGRDLRAVGLAIGVTEDTAQKRVSRALDKLAEFLKRRGVVMSVGGLGTVLLANAASAAPAHLTAKIGTVAMASRGAGMKAHALFSKSYIRASIWQKVSAILFIALAFTWIFFNQRSQLANSAIFDQARPGVATFQMRLVADAPSTNSTEMTLADSRSGKPHHQAMYVQNAVLLDLTALKSVKVIGATPGIYYISITFTADGGKRFAEVTRQNIHKRLAITIDGKLCCAPVIQGEIPDGKANISGDFSQAEVEQLAAKLNSALRR